MNVRVGATWIAGTKAYTLLEMWLHCEDGLWETWVYIEIKWEKRRRFTRAPWTDIEYMLRQDGAVIQDGPSVQRFE